MSLAEAKAAKAQRAKLIKPPGRAEAKAAKAKAPSRDKAFPDRQLSPEQGRQLPRVKRYTPISKLIKFRLSNLISEFY